MDEDCRFRVCARSKSFSAVHERALRVIFSGAPFAAYTIRVAR